MTCWQFRQRNPDILFFMVTPVNKPSSLQGTLSRFLILRKICPPRLPSLLKRFLNQPLLPVSFPFPFFTSTSTILISPFPSFTVNPSKTTKSTGLSMNRASAEAKGNSGRSGTICSEILPISVEREGLTESFRISLVHCSFRPIRSESCQKKRFRYAIVFKTQGDDIFERDY
jgi:hypothetical protein